MEWCLFLSHKPTLHSHTFFLTVFSSDLICKKQNEMQRNQTVELSVRATSQCSTDCAYLYGNTSNWWCLALHIDETILSSNTLVSVFTRTFHSVLPRPMQKLLQSRGELNVVMTEAFSFYDCFEYWGNVKDQSRCSCERSEQIFMWKSLDSASKIGFVTLGLSSRTKVFPSIAPLWPTVPRWANSLHHPKITGSHLHVPDLLSL